MKIEYAILKDTKKLENVDGGAIFRPINSQEIYLALDITAQNDIFYTDNYAVEDKWLNYQNHTLETYNDLIACVNLNDGDLVFFHKDLEVIELNHKLLIESEN